MEHLTHTHKLEIVPVDQEDGDDWCDTMIKNTPMALQKIRDEMKRVGKEMRTIVLVVGSESPSAKVFGPGSTAVACMPSNDGPQQLNLLEHQLIEGLLTVARLRAEVGTKSEYAISSTNPEAQERLSLIYSRIEVAGVLNKAKAP